MNKFMGVFYAVVSLAAIANCYSAYTGGTTPIQNAFGWVIATLYFITNSLECLGGD